MIDNKRKEEALKTFADEEDKNIDETSLLKGKKILIIQDDSEIYMKQETLCIDIGAEKSNVTIAVDYRQAIKELQKNKFDLILLDMGFPGENYRHNKWSGIYVLEYMISQNIMIPVLTWSTLVRELGDMVAHIDWSEHRNLFEIKNKLSKFVEVFKVGEGYYAFPERVQSLLQRNKAISIGQKFPSKEASAGL